MPTFQAPDGTVLACHVSGDGPPLICLPGGPMRASAYFGDLGGLAAAGHRVIGLDLRGTGASAAATDPASYRCDRLVDDVEALRLHLGLDRMRLLGHSAGAELATLYTARYPKRVSDLVLVTPGGQAVGEEATAEDRLETARLRRDEEWFPAAYEALEAVTQGRTTESDWEAVAPFTHGRWDPAARAHRAAGPQQRNQEAGALYDAEGAFAPAATREALSAFEGRTLLLAGEFDVAAPPRAVTAAATAFPDARTVVLPAAGHFPWHDDREGFVRAVTDFLG
ncbi:alpha/beta hydrolase [Streptomyces sp. Tu 2975]|uniref:alpha/beta fold hydrolase n=1 Tax=Streptomyces sp. Tu 2975 TaxID=2676871 RepID=UPI00135B6A1B|nr:alpha/beta hydrolase [Streptomyces sp. Tu 2975]QIP83828.1 alpha/beta hydrolase [Streptomyces sp. Tu 2975]